jgi:uncharacterized membrane protein YphA (DoxX/SURF4 family)
MTMNLNFATAGEPRSQHRHHRMRSALSLVAALAGAFAVLAAIFLVIGTVSPAEAGLAYGAVIVLLAIWLTGIWWRWDSPDRRDPGLERERRGF